jgi:hypothetical protein
VLSGHSWKCEPAQHGLESDADLVELLELLQAEGGHDRGGIRPHAYQPFLGESCERFSHLGSVDAELDGELVLV